LDRAGDSDCDWFVCPRILHGLDWRLVIVGVPEPTTLALAGLGLAALVVSRRKKA